MRKDVHHFFESVNQNKVLMNLRNDGRVSLQTIQLCAILMKIVRDTEYEKNFFTTMFDLYSLPGDFPGMKDLPTDGYQKVEHLERALSEDINHYRFIPYIELHEFETLVLCDVKSLRREYPTAQRELTEMDEKWRKETRNQPEFVYTNYDTAPSKRIIKAIENKYRYNKPKMAVEATKNIGIDKLCALCPHFGKWIDTIKRIYRIVSVCFLPLRIS